MKFIPRIASAGAIAIAMALGGGVAQASTLTVPAAFNYSLQGQALSGAVAAQVLPTLTVTFGADYVVADSIALTIAGATVDTSTDANLLVPANMVCSGAPNVVLSYFSRTGGVITLRVSQTNVLHTAGTVCTIANIAVTAASLNSAATTITANWQAVAGSGPNIGQSFDSLVPPGAVTVASVVDQFHVSSPILATSVFNGVIDVSAVPPRTKFVATDDGNIAGQNDDTLVLDTNNGFSTGTVPGPVTFTGPVATLDSNNVTITGTAGFQEIDLNKNGDCSDDAIGTDTFAGPGTLAFAKNCLSFLYSAPLAQALHTQVAHTISLSGGTGLALSPQTFSASVAWAYHLGGTTGARTDVIPVGGWTLNGFNAFVSYLPYGATISRVVYITNKSAVDGTVTVTGYNDSGVACSFAAGTALHGQVTQLSGALDAGFTGCYGGAFAGKVSFNVFATFPAALGELYSAYNVNGNRLTVINNSNAKNGTSTVGSGL